MAFSILLVAGDKAGQWTAWYREATPLAEQRYETYLKERAPEEGANDEQLPSAGATSELNRSRVRGARRPSQPASKNFWPKSPATASAEARRSRGLTQQQVAERMGITAIA